MATLPFDRTTPTILVRVKLPGAKDATRVSLEDIEVTPRMAQKQNIDPQYIGSKISRVLSMTYEDTEKGADKCVIRINNYDLRFPDDGTFATGNMLYVSWGYAGYMSQEREMVITVPLPGITFTVECQFAAAVKANQAPVDQTYYGLTYSEIAVKVAERNGFGAAAQFIEPVPFTPEHVVQHNLTDAQFMKKLAKEIGYAFFIDGSGLHFHPQAFSQPPRKRLEYFADSDRGELLEYPSWEKPPAAQPGKVSAKGIDPITKKPISAEGSNATTKGRPGLAKNLEIIDRRTAQTSLRPLAGKEAVATAMTATSAAEAKTKTQGLYKKASSQPRKCSAQAHGDPAFSAKSVVELSGIGRELSGLYYCSAVTHSIEPGKYTMSLKLQRDGTNGSGGVGTAKTEAKTNDKKTPAEVAAGGAPRLEQFQKINRVTGQTSTGFRPPGPKK